MLCLKYCRAAASAWATPKTKAAAESIAGAAVAAAAATASAATNH